MEGLQNRIDSFSKTKRVKNPSKPSSTLTLKWPHPATFTANPDTLAEAGFFYNPSAEDPDNTTCFMCEKQLSDWEEDDDPFDIHFDKCAQKCSWANIRCGLRRDMDRNGRFVFQDKSRVPTSKAMEKARLETFTAGDGWMHDKVRNHGASSKKLAKAGFVFTSNSPGDDLASCLYCNTSLSGWDKDDDPLEEHRKRKDKSGFPCPFFAGDNDSESASPESLKPSSKASSSKPPSRTASKSKQQHQDMIMPTKTFDADGDDYSDSTGGGSSVPAKTPSRKPRAASGSTRKPSAKTPRSRSTSRSLKNVVEVEDEGEAEDVQEPPATVKRKKATTTRARSKSVARSGTEVEEDEEEEVELAIAAAPSTTVKKKRTATRAKSVARSVASEDDEDMEEPVVVAPTTAKKKKATTSKSKSVVAAAVARLEQQSDLDDTPAVRKTTRSKGKGKVPTPQETEEEEQQTAEEEEPVPRKSSRSKSKATTTTGPRTAKKPAALTKSRSKAKIVVTEEEGETGDDSAQLSEVVKQPRTAKKPASKVKGKTTAATTTKKLQSRDVPISEDEFGPIIEQPPFAPAAAAKAKPPSSSTTGKKQPLAGAAALGKGRPPPSSRAKPAPPAPTPVPDTDTPTPVPTSQTDDDDELGGYVPPFDRDEDVEMTPLVIPKRTRIQSGKEDVQRTVTKAVRATTTTTNGNRKPSSSSSSVAKVRASMVRVQGKARGEMKVVDVSSDEEEEAEVESVVVDEDEEEEAGLVDVDLREVAQGKVEAEKKVEEVIEEKVVAVEELRVDLQSKTKGKMKKEKGRLLGSSVFGVEEKGGLVRSTSSSLIQVQSIASVPTSTTTSSSALQSHNIAQDKGDEQQIEDEYYDGGDVSMQETELAETLLFEEDDDAKMDDVLVTEAPRTPLRPGSHYPPAQPGFPATGRVDPSSSQQPQVAVEVHANIQAKETDRQQQQQREAENDDEKVPEEPAPPPFFPPLSKLPFVPLPQLTEAEMDMTVEEWIRYQMEVEVDKFRRDGERELQRFRRRGEEVRRVIEGL